MTLRYRGNSGKKITQLKKSTIDNNIIIIILEVILDEKIVSINDFKFMHTLSGKVRSALALKSILANYL